MKQSTEAAWERAMKIQEVMLRAMAGSGDHRDQLSADAAVAAPV